MWRLLLTTCFVCSVGGFELTILHTNDIHSRFDQTNSRSGRCSDQNAQEGECFGGFPRLSAKVQELRAKYNNTVLVDAGDQFQGTIWFYAYGGNITAHFMNAVGYDVMSLGNHEFDNGPASVEEFLELVRFPVVSSNVDAGHYPELQSRLNKSLVLDVGGERVGFVGYTTVDTLVISNPGMVGFSDEVEAVRAEVDRLTQQGVNKIVCVGHAGFVKDLRIAREVAGVDVVVGGHTNTFLYTGEPPSEEDPVGDYPEVVTREDGSRALVVQDYAFGKYLGFLQVQFNDTGELTSWSGNPILLNSSVPRDNDTREELDMWWTGVQSLVNKTVGRSAVLLLGDRQVCRLEECNLGNLIADAMVMHNLRHSDGLAWNHVSIALLNSGGIRASFEKGDITMADVLTVQPFRSTIDIVEVNGSALIAIMEHSASQWDPKELHGGFLQHSGLHVQYDMSRSVGDRVVEVKVKCTDCQVPSFVDLEEHKVYKVILPNFLAAGGDGYKVITDNMLLHHLNGDLDSDVLVEYISKFSPLIQGLEGRIRFLNHTSPDPCNISGSATASLTSLTVMSAMVAFASLLAIVA